MQLDKLVEYHKALADPTRIRILFLLKNGPLHGQALAGKLGVSAPTITHHMTKLRNAGVVKERRDKNTIYFELNHSIFKQNAEAVLKAFFGTSTTDKERITVDQQERFRNSVLNTFFTLDGRLKQIPAQRKRKLVVFEHLLRDLKPGQKYSEKEISDYIRQFHEDYCTIRREFIINNYMYRENNMYELNPREMWADWRTM
ncbi:MAG: metalloregulator ArsR/SmtB family transcription factor [Alicyclobacillus sp.]|nr:metalloregulator ArsR/SmtB family transcription factor [Alicyclobacillus sp.]